jgi:hypothetical protein
VGAFSPNGILEQHFSLKKRVMEKHFSWKLRRGRKILARKGVKKTCTENGGMKNLCVRNWNNGEFFDQKME